MEMITFAINNASLHYASFVGGLTCWLMLTAAVFKFDLGRYLFFVDRSRDNVIEGKVLAVLDADSEVIV